MRANIGVSQAGVSGVFLNVPDIDTVNEYVSREGVTEEMIADGFSLIGTIISLRPFP